MMKLLMQGGTASAIFILSLVIASGLYLGRFKVKGVSLGSTWILFVGILLSHFGLRINPTMLGFIKDFGLILFVFAIGLQVGPGFFRSFRKDGLSMNIMAIVMVALAVGTTYVIHLVTGEDLAIMTGVMSGAVTNTPGLGAAQQILEEGGVNSGPIASAYAVAYPLGVLGALFVVIVCKALFRIDLDKEREKASKGDSTDANAYRLACRVENPALFGKSIHDIVGEVNSDHLVIARMKRGEDIFFPDLDMPLKEGDELLIVTDIQHKDTAGIIFGAELPVNMKEWQKPGTELVSRRLSITKSVITGHSLRNLDIRQKYGVTVTRILRKYDRNHMFLGCRFHIWDTEMRSPACFKVAAAAACVAAVIGGAGAAYAADLGGIQRTVQVWIHGDQTNATLVVENGAYTLDYQDANGNAAHRGGGGVVMNPDGTERPATEEELLSEINAPDVSYEDDGRVIVYYLGQALDVTDQFENGVCYVQLQVDGKTQYMTIKYQNGYAISPNSYVQPDKFN